MNIRLITDEYHVKNQATKLTPDAPHEMIRFRSWSLNPSCTATSWRNMAAQHARIWFHPTRFWAASHGMPPERSEEILDAVFRLAEKRDYDGLRKYEFVSVEFRPTPGHSEPKDAESLS